MPKDNSYSEVIKKINSEAKASEIPLDTKQLADSWFASNQIKVTSLDSLYDPAYPDNGIDDIEDMFVHEMLLKSKFSVKGITESTLKRGFRLSINEKFSSFKDDYKKTVDYDPKLSDKGLAELARWLRLLTDKDDPKNVAIMQHFIWQVCRKMYHKPVTWHLMPVIIGQQGSGKSIAVSKLLKPIELFVAQGQSVDVIESAEKAFPLFTKNYVCLLDEMSRASKTDVNKLKSVITQDSLTYRRYHSQRFETKPNICTFIGTSNDSLADQIKDTSGMRRFAVINTTNIKDKNKAERERVWEEINNIDYLAIWRGVNHEQATPPIEPYMDQIAMDQEHLRTKDVIELFIDECGVERDGEVITKGADLYKEFTQYSRECGLKHTLTRQNFYRKLEDRGIQRHREKGRRTALFKCRLDNADSSDLLDSINSLQVDNGRTTIQ